MSTRSSARRSGRPRDAGPACEEEACAPLTLRQGSCGAEPAARGVGRLFRSAGRFRNCKSIRSPNSAIDLRELLLWQSRRTMEDFWGPKPGAVQAMTPQSLTSKSWPPTTPIARAAPPTCRPRGWSNCSAAESVVRPSVDPEKLLADDTIAEIPRMTANVGGLPRGDEAAALPGYLARAVAATFRDNHLPVRRLPVDTQNVGPFPASQVRHRQD